MKNLKFFVFFLVFIISCAPPRETPSDSTLIDSPEDANIVPDDFYSDSGDIDPSTLSPEQLLPDADADGDGTPNSLDPLPLNPNIGGTESGGQSALGGIAAQTVGSILGPMGYMLPYMMMSQMQRRGSTGMTTAGIGMNTPACVAPTQGSKGNAKIDDTMRLEGGKFHGAQGEITFNGGKFERKIPQGSSKGTYSIVEGTLILKPDKGKCVLAYALVVEDGKCTPAVGVECPDAKNPCKAFDPNIPNVPVRGTLSQIQMSGVPTTKNAELSSGHYTRHASGYKCNSMALTNPRTVASFSGGSRF